ncbi:MAG: multicopper oxidase domain-containing protein, partial [Alphaproteobacteria bacterium]
DHVVMLSDWTDEDANHLYARLKKAPAADNLQQRTMADFFADIDAHGLAATLADRKMWGDMRMDPTDFADVTAATYSYLINGQGAGAGPQANWTALFKPGQSLRLRFINAAAMTIFNVKIPGLEMQVVAVDGQPVQPVFTDEFQISVAETYDVIVRPKMDQAYTIYAGTSDGMGYARGTLAPRAGMAGEVPPLEKPPLLTMSDMGADMRANMGHDMNMAAMDHAKMDHSKMDHSKMGHGRPRKLTYQDLRARAPWPDQRPPRRNLIINLTGNMERYMWSFDGVKYSEVKGPIPFTFGERLKLTLINQTMMNHPIHLHGMWMELDVGQGPLNPRKHTINVKPGGKASAFITADAKGLWAFHCHLLMHMKAGMMRAVQVSGEVA